MEACAPRLNKTATQVAKYLESDEVYHQTEYIVMVWSKTGLSEGALARQLRQLVHAANKRREGGPLDLSKTNWMALARRYAEMFSD